MGWVPKIQCSFSGGAILGVWSWHKDRPTSHESLFSIDQMEWSIASMPGSDILNQVDEIVNYGKDVSQPDRLRHLLRDCGR